MDDGVALSLTEQVKKEKFARKLGLRLIEVKPGYAVVEMKLREDFTNIFGMAHGGAIFSLIDEAFEISGNAHGTVAVALSMSITYHKAPDPKARLRAESKEIHRSAKTATYEIRVTDEDNALIASCSALAYRKQDRLPFLEETQKEANGKAKGRKK
jgi:acyl-CoA thioesterase